MVDIIPLNIGVSRMSKKLIGLQPEDLDLDERLISVRHAIVKKRKTTPKNGKSRKIDMSLQLAEALKKHLLERERETLRKGWKEPPELLFYNENGGPIDPDNLRKRHFYKCLKKAGLRKIRLHDCRHTYATLLISQGESLAYVRDQLGHSNISTTVDTHGHLVPGENRQAVDQLDDQEPSKH
jgi:integrase